MSRRAFAIIMSVLAAAIIALAGADMALETEKTWDSEYPMANSRISWEQTFHSGAWSE